MKENKTLDRRVRKTKQAIHTALLELLETKNFSDIRINELTEKADVNRKTFYNHYADIDQVMHEIESEVAEKLVRVVADEFTNLPQERLQSKEVYDLFKGKIVAFFSAAITEFQNHPVYIKLLNTPEIEHDFQHRVVQEELRTVMKIFGNHIGNEQWLEYYLQFILSGSVSVIKMWAKQGYPASAEDMATFFTKLFQTMDGINCIEEMSSI